LAEVLPPVGWRHNQSLSDEFTFMSVPSVIFTPYEDYHQALESAAQLRGIESAYWDIWGNHHVTSTGARRAILESLGVRAASLPELNEDLETRLWNEWSRLSPPVLVLSEAATPPEISLRVPVELEAAPVHVDLEWENGGQGSAGHSLPDLETTAAAELRGRRFVEKKLPLTASPLGYHRLRITVGCPSTTLLKSETQLIIAPEKAYLPPALQNQGKRAGLCVSLYGIHSERSWGCGDFSDLGRLCGWVAAAGGSFVALNPLHALHNRQPFNTSPYLPNCVYYQNFIYLDIERIDDYRNSQWARNLRRHPSIVKEIREVAGSDLVEYERVARLKSRFLQLAFRQFLREYARNTARAAEFDRFVAAEGDLLHRYAVYSALDKWIHRNNPAIWTWPEWPAEYQDPASPEVRQFAEGHRRQVLFYKYVQWQIDRQLAEAQAAARQHGLSIGLFHDLALATDSCGSDLWAHRDFFVPGCRVGAPPDDFSPLGQDWSFPPPSSDRHREDAYRLFRESIRKCCRHGGALRIDHVMRFFRLFWIPPGKVATEGTYVRDNYEDLVRILALESVRNKVLIIGEDLGTVEPEFREVLGRFGILSYRLFYFEKDEHGNLKAPDQYPPQAMVSSTTHDLPTLAGFWLGSDVKARRKAGVFPDEGSYRQALAHRRGEKQKMLDGLHNLGLLPGYVSRKVDDLPELTGELHNAITGYLSSTPSMLLALNQEDLTKETQQQNLPGTTARYPNWRRKMRYSIEELETSKTVADFALMFRNWLDKTGRAEV
jgi:4-alpha-glucanotransferase